LVGTRNSVRTAALRAEIIALRATVASLQAELETLRSATAATAPLPASAPTPATAPPAPKPEALTIPAPGPVVLDLPLIRLALAGVAVDRGEDSIRTEIVLPTPVTADGRAVALADLPERRLLDPAHDRPTDPVDPTSPADRRSQVELLDRRTA
jgi:hypothetical protein